MSSISNQIAQFIGGAQSPVNVGDLYRQIRAHQHSIRARLHYMAKDGKVMRVAKGLYIGAGKQLGAVADARVAVRELADQGAKFDFIILDLPYKSPGTKGGKRNLADFPTITPDEFGLICKDVRRMLATDESPALFVFSKGKSCDETRRKYQDQIEAYLAPAHNGEYAKINANGTQFKFGRHPMPKEGLWLYTVSGRISGPVNLDFEFIRPKKGKYPTEKPVPMVREITAQVLPDGGLVLDPFAGSACTAKACAGLDCVSSLSFDILPKFLKLFKRHFSQMNLFTGHFTQLSI